MKKNILILILLTVLANVKADSVYISKKSGNIRIGTSDNLGFFNRNKIFLIGELAEKLSLKLGYKENIQIDFKCFFHKKEKLEFTIAYDSSSTKSHGQRITIHMSAYDIEAETTLKLVECAIQNISKYKNTNKTLIYGPSKKSYDLPNIDTNIIKTHLSKPNSKSINETLAITIQEKNKKIEQGIYYTLKNNSYYLYANNYEFEDSQILSVKNFYGWKKLSSNLFLIFDTDSSFYYTNLDSLKVSKRQVFQSKNIFYDNYKIEYLGGDKISIYYDTYVYDPKSGNNKRIDHTLIYLIDKDFLIQDLEGLIERK